MSRLYLRLFGWFVIANLLTLLITAFISNRVARHAYEAMEPDWALLAQQIAERVDESRPGSLRRWNEFLDRRGIDIVVLSADGRPLPGIRPPRPLPPLLQKHLAELVASDEVILRSATGLTLAGIKVDREGREAMRVLAIRHPRPPEVRLLWITGLQLLVSALVIAAVGWIIARSISRPVAAVQAAAHGVASGELGTRVGAPHTLQRDELGQLARDFDAMAERIQALVVQTRGLLQDISHELRSPLARLQLAVELARGSCGEAAAHHIDRAQREVDRLDRLIGQVLALSRLEGQLSEPHFERLALDALCTEQLDAHRDAAARHGIELQRRLQPLHVCGDRALLERALDNLLGNAIKFSPERSVVTLVLQEDADQAVLSVLDQGAGIPEDELERVFQPFFRGRNAALAEGQGLGLSIVRRIAQTHHGSVSAENLAHGGLALRLRLPLATC